MIRVFGTALMAASLLMLSASEGEQRIDLVIRGGHDTDPRDHGRPVVLIANGLGVQPEVFREASSQVTPAPAGREPTPEEVRANKDALLGALSQYGVTNDLLDRVSNFYRYQPGGDRIWRSRPAKACVIVRDGTVQSVTVTDPGAGYSSPPEISLPGYPKVKLEAKLVFSRDLARNGSIESIAVNNIAARR